MPRLKTLAPIYAYKDLSKALKKGLIDKEMKKIELAQRMMVSDSSVGRWIANPEKMTVERLRSLVVVLGVDLVPVLKALGYTERAIKKMVIELANRFRREGECGEIRFDAKEEQ